MIRATVQIDPEAMRELNRLLAASMRKAMKRKARDPRVKLTLPREDEHAELWRIYRQTVPFTDFVEVQR